MMFFFSYSCIAEYSLALFWRLIAEMKRVENELAKQRKA